MKTVTKTFLLWKGAFTTNFLRESSVLTFPSKKIDISDDEKHFFHGKLDEQELKIGFPMGEMFETDKTEHFWV